MKTHLQNESLIDVPLGDVRVEVGTFDKPQEELVDDLKMRPCKFEYRLVLLWVVSVTGRVHRRRDRAEEVGGELYT
jgi:hypothetical protein